MAIGPKKMARHPLFAYWRFRMYRSSRLYLGMVVHPQAGQNRQFSPPTFCCLLVQGSPWPWTSIKIGDWLWSAWGRWILRLPCSWSRPIKVQSSPGSWLSSSGWPYAVKQRKHVPHWIDLTPIANRCRVTLILNSDKSWRLVVTWVRFHDPQAAVLASTCVQKR